MVSVHGDTAVLEQVLRVADRVVPADPYASVKLDQLRDSDHRLIPQHAVMIETDLGWKWVATHSEKYLLFPNSRVGQVVTDVIARADVGVPRLAAAMWNGKRFGITYELPDVSIEASKNDKLVLGVEGINSYDGSVVLGVRFLARRMACSNGLYFTELLGSFSFRHLSQNEVDIEESISLLQGGCERFLKLAPFVRAMQTISVGLCDVLSWHYWFLAQKPRWPDSMTGRVLRLLSATIQPYTLWELLNAWTAVATHELEPISGARMSEAACRYAVQQVTEQCPELAGRSLEA